AGPRTAAGEPRSPLPTRSARSRRAYTPRAHIFDPSCPSITAGGASLTHGEPGRAHRLARGSAAATHVVTTRTAARCPPQRRRSALERPAQQLVDDARAGLAAGGLHHLPDEESQQLCLPRAVLRDRTRVRGDDLLDGGGNRALVADLRKPLRLDDRVRIPPGRPHPFEHGLPGRRVDRARV